MPGPERLLAQIIMPLHLRKGPLELELSTTSATLGSNLNVTLQELFIETAYPLGEASEQAYKEIVRDVGRLGAESGDAYVALRLKE